MIKTTLHIILVFSVFFSSGGLWISQHFCHKEQTGTSFIAILGTCCSNEVSPCSESEAALVCDHEEEGCCHNQSEFYKLDQDQLIAEIKLKPLKLNISDFALTPYKHFETPVLDRSHLKYYSYVPPPIVIDCRVQLQTFLC